MQKEVKIFFDFEATSVSRDCDPVSLGMVAVKGDDIISTFYAEFTDFNYSKADMWVIENIICKLAYQESPGLVDTLIEENGFKSIRIKFSSQVISTYLKSWLNQFDSPEFWCDFGVIDIPLLVDLISDWDIRVDEDHRYINVSSKLVELVKDPSTNSIDKLDLAKENFTIYAPNHKVGLPKHKENIRYFDFYDIHTAMKVRGGVNKDINREELVGDKEIRDILNNPMLSLEYGYTLEKHNALFDAAVTHRVYEYYRIGKAPFWLGHRPKKLTGEMFSQMLDDISEKMSKEKDGE